MTATQGMDLRPVVETWNAVRLGLDPDLSGFPPEGGPIGGYVLCENGRWRSLPAMRELIRGCHRSVVDDESPIITGPADAEWIEFLARNMLGRPEMYNVRLSQPMQDLFQTWTHQTDYGSTCHPQDQAVLDMLTAAHPMVADVWREDHGSYPYIDVMPKSTKEYSEHLQQSDKAVPSGLGPIADRATEALFDDKARHAFLAAYDQHTADHPTVAPVEADRAFRNRLLGTRGRATTLENRAAAAEVVYRALRLAVYWRVESYLAVRFPGWRDQLNVNVPLGTERDFVPIDTVSGRRRADLPATLASLPVPHRWVAVWPFWVEQFDYRVDVSPVFSDLPRSLNIVRTIPPDARADREFAALVELAYDDVCPKFDGSGSQTDAQRMFYRALQTLLLFDKHTAAIHKPVDLTRVTERLPKPEGEKRNNRNNHGTKKSPGGGAHQDRSLHDLDEYLEKTRAADSIESLDPDLLHRWASLLRSDSTSQRAPRSQQLTERITRVLREGEHLDGYIVDIVDSAQLLSFDMTNHSPHRTGELFGPILGAVRTVDAPLAASIWRSLAIQLSKVHQYGQAQLMLYGAVNLLNRIATRSSIPGGERTEINLLEACQQVYLQSTGLHARIVEMLLSDPAKRAAASEYTNMAEYAYLSTMARHAMEAGGHAYDLLKQVDDQFGLPLTQQRHRAATRNWQINTRAMHMRTLLLMATLHAAEGEQGLRLVDRSEAEKNMRALRDAVPRIFREAAKYPAAVNFGPELTRIAIHYALLNGMRFIRPDDRQYLPKHLAEPSKPTGNHDPGYAVFDLDAATAYLIEKQNDAGILSNIQYEPVRRALARYSNAPDGQLQTNYEHWMHQSGHSLRRPFDPDQFMPGHQLFKPPPIVRIER